MKGKLLLDVMLGTLRPYLRMCGYDTCYALDVEVESDEAIRALAESERRTVLTRDRELARTLDDAVLVESRDVEEQLEELAAAGFDLELTDEPMYCGSCNGPLEPIDSAESPPEHAPDDVTEVWRCQRCGQHFWTGSHWDDVRETLAGIGTKS